MKAVRTVVIRLLVGVAFLAVSCGGAGDGNEPGVCDDDAVDGDATGESDYDTGDYPAYSYRIVGVEVEEGNTYRLANRLFPGFTGDLWPSAWGADDRLYVANGDGFGFGLVWSDIVVSIVDGYPPYLEGTTPPLAFGGFVAGVWGPESWMVNRKPTGMACVDGDLYLFFQNLKTAWSDNPFGDAPHASISVSRDGGYSWEYDPTEPMFTDHIFTTGFFLDYGKCNEHAFDDYVYVYGLDYNWRFSPGFSQTKLYLARVPKDRILDRSAWEFFAGTDADGRPTWSADIDDKVPVLVDDTEYRGGYSGICQGSVVYIPRLNRYLYSTRAVYEWIFWESPKPWGPWTRVSVIEWTGEWTETYHPGYPAIIPSKFMDADGRGGWIISSLPQSWLGGAFYNMAMRRFWLEVEEQPEE